MHLLKKTAQQTDGYSCGVHLLVNSKHVIGRLISNGNEPECFMLTLKEVKIKTHIQSNIPW